MIPVSEPYMKGNEMAYVVDCIKTNWISSGGQYINKFERQYASLFDVKFATSTSNGTASLHLALVACGVREGDEVIIPNLTFISTANAVKYCSAKPVLVDVDIHTACMDADLIEEKITERTKAIIPVHLYGNVAEMDKIVSIAKKHNIFIIEDAAEAHGAKFGNKYVGSIGDIGCYSFFGNKIITTGEGGMCTTSVADFYNKMVLYKNHGMSQTEKFYHPVIGFNYRMTNIQAAIGLAQIENFDEIISLRDRQYRHYMERLEGVSGIRFLRDTPGTRSVNWMFSVLIDDAFPLSRNAVLDNLRENQIDARPFFKPINHMPAYRDDNKYRNTETLSEIGLNLPSSAGISTEQINYVCDVIHRMR